ncbi:MULTISPECIES: RNA polymerase sigma factor SigJ [Streptomyces]|uniref:RNA polymerase sigma factor SigJ n=1 Tax=Streptomyces TaxID=1883 RepID=UPI001587B64D|nr:RNA polymerase sigma factor SigJ [Streptomyces sp. CAI-85]MBO7940921.1 RNA polymerase sigma factor SigJ [Streptomyces sp. S9]NUV59204.1 sigma-70 family RNA polymerase sigma factor [Streptomyces sp. CAI-85]
MAEATAVSERSGISDPFEQHRQLMFGISYRMLGTVADAEDVVQETWLRWRRVDRDAVADPRGYLVRAVTRTAIDQMRRSRARREEYVGPWLPEPLLVSSDVALESSLRGESLSMAVLVMMETLSPLERAVFVLHEVFGFSFPEVAEAVDRTEQAVRQLGSRARRHVRLRRRRFEPDRRQAREITERFLAACLSGDVEALMAVLAPDVTMWADGNGHAETPRVPLHGAAAIADYFASTAGRYPQGLVVRLHEQYDGSPAAVLATPAGVFAVVVVDVAEPAAPGAPPRVTAVRAVRNPEKLGRVPAGR